MLIVIRISSIAAVALAIGSARSTKCRLDVMPRTEEDLKEKHTIRTIPIYPCPQHQTSEDIQEPGTLRGSDYQLRKNYVPLSAASSISGKGDSSPGFEN